jgi:hypothetical protein
MKSIFFFPLFLVLISCQGAMDNNTGSEMYLDKAEYLSQEEMAGDIEPARAPSSSDAYDFIDDQPGESEKHLAFAEGTGQSEQQPSQPATKKQAQKIIRTARMTMEVRKYVQALDSLKNVLDRFEARIESEEESRHSYRVQNQFTIRMAPEKLESLMVAIEAIGIDVDNKSINSRDVTARYVDLETRLASKRAVIQRYREILKTAKTVKDILDVEEHLRQVVEEVESMEGQLRVLKNQVGESTLYLTVYETFDRSNVKKETFWSRIGKALGNGWRGGQEFLIGVVSLWPFWIVVGVLGWGIRRMWRKRKARKEK